VINLAFSLDGTTLASASEDQSIRLWDVATLKPLGTLASHIAAFTSVAFSPDGDTVASATVDGDIILQNLKTRRQSVLLGHDAKVMSMAFSSDGSTLASAGWDRTVRLWDMKTHRASDLDFIRYSAAVFSVVFLDDATVASLSENGSMNLWDLKTPHSTEVRLVRRYDDRYLESLRKTAFNTDATILAAELNRRIFLWNFDIKSLEVQGCKIVNRNLTRTEWTKFFGDRPYNKTCSGFSIPGEPAQQSK
jgi:WD40 repeat protein